MVTLPVSTGQMSVFPTQEEALVQLSCGVISIHAGRSIYKFYVSNGYAALHGDQIADLITLEASPLQKGRPEVIQMKKSPS